MSEARTERLGRAREAVRDVLVPNLSRLDTDLALSSAEIAARVATQVRITPDLLDAFGRAWHEADRAAEREGTRVSGTRRAAGMRAAFEAAGFEVEQ